MDIELIVTGDEIVRGAVADTNSGWLLRRLVELGASPRRVTVVGDDALGIESALREASTRADVVVVSGGLGPTSDDLTAGCVAHVAGVPLELHVPTLERLRERWARRARPMPPQAERQALVPAIAEVLDNDEGTAPGFRVRLGWAEAFCFAGVPREFVHMCERHLFPRLRASGLATAARTLRCVGITESELDALLMDVAARHGLRLGLRAVFPEAWATFVGSGTGAGASVDEAVAEARRLVGDRCFSTDGETLPEVVLRLGLERGATLAVAESCTGGLLGAAVTEVPGSSAFFVGGVLSYANEEKTRALGVEPGQISEHGAVSEPVARAMAEGARARLGTTHALAITGVAGPGGGSEEKPVGTVWIALATPAGTQTRLLKSIRTDRSSVREASVSAALDLLRLNLLGTAS